MQAKTMVWIWILFYALITVMIYAFGNLLLYDFIVLILVLVTIMIFVRRFKIPFYSVLFFGLGTLPHTIGMVPFYVGEEKVSLYHGMFFGGHYDVFTHMVGFLLFSLGVLIFYFKNYPICKSNVVISYLSLIGAGNIIEVTEYLGYRIFGIGWGFLAFGEGDNSYHFGPWGDSMTDCIANIAGISIAFLIFFLHRNYLTKRLLKRKDYKS